MRLVLGDDPLLFPTLGADVLPVVRVAYAVLLLATLLAALPHARRYFLSERWGGYAQRGASVDIVQNPVVLPVLLAAWLAAAVGLIVGSLVVVAALINFVCCRYFFIQMRWRGVLRGMGAPGFIAYWLSLAVLLLEYTSRHAPAQHGLALLVLQVDFAAIMLSAGMYKYSAGYRQNEGMELGMVNPEWGYWPRFWQSVPPGARVFRVLNELAWSVEVLAALLMLLPPTRFIGGSLLLASFIFIATQIRLGFLCEMVIVCCLLFAHPGSVVAVWLTAIVSFVTGGAAPAAVTLAPPAANAALAAALWGYLALLPLARLGLSYNFHGKRSLPGVLQVLLERYTNAFGLIIWRVFSADITNFFIRIHERTADGSRRLLSDWGRSLRYRQVAESITVTSLFTTLKYYPSNNGLFVERLLRYARTVAAPSGTLVFEYVSIAKRNDRFVFTPVAEYDVRPTEGTVVERTLDPTTSVRAPAGASPVHEGTRPGSYAPASRSRVSR